MQQLSWDGKVYGFQTRPGNGCRCADDRPAPAGLYQISIQTFASEDDAVRGQNGSTVTVGFALPLMPGGVVNVDRSKPGI